MGKTIDELLEDYAYKFISDLLLGEIDVCNGINYSYVYKALKNCALPPRAEYIPRIAELARDILFKDYGVLLDIDKVWE